MHAASAPTPPFWAPIAVLALASTARAQEPPWFPEAHYVLAEVRTVGTGDLDSDGRVDAVAAYEDLHVLLGDGVGGLTPTAPQPLDGTASHLLVLDVDGDGHLDVLAAVQAPNAVVVLLGDGAGSLAVAGTYPLPGAPTSLALGDLDEDGSLDVVVGRADGWVTVLLAADGAAFTPATPLLAASSPVDWIDLGDLDADGHVDLAVDASTVRIAFGKGDGTFEAPWSPVGSHPYHLPYHLAIADVDGDGDEDLAVATSHELLIVFDEGGTLGSSPTVGLTTDEAYEFFRIEDMNHDGDADFVAVGGPPTHPHLHVALGDGTGTFLETSQHRMKGAASVSQLDLADLDGKAGLDVLVAQGGWDGVTVFLGGSHGQLIGAEDLLSSTFADAEPADLDGDGAVDLVLEYSDSLFVALGDGTGAFDSPTAAQPTGGDDSREVVLADLDADGRPDALVPHMDTDTIGVLLGTAGGGFAAAVPYPCGDRPAVVDTGDLDGDGHVDAVVGNDSVFASGISALLGDGAGALGAPIPTPLPIFVKDLAVADLDADGLSDVAAVSSDSNEVHVLLSQGAGTFGAPVPLGSGLDPDVVATADLDDDGNVDVVALSGVYADLDVFFGDGSGGFSPALTLDAAPKAGRSLAIADLDRDGALDLVAGTLNGHITVFPGGAAGAFGAPRRFQTLLSYVSATDVDGDGLVDLVLTAWAPPHLLRNQLQAPAGVSTFGAGSPGCLGTLGISANVEPRVDTPDFAVTGTGAPADAAGFGFVAPLADTAGADSLGLDLVLHVDLLASPFTIPFPLESDSGGSVFAPLPIPSDPVLADQQLFVQTVWLWPSQGICDPSALGLVSSRGLSVVIQP